MQGLIDTILENMTSINWEGPAAFVVAIIVIFVFMRKWSMLLLIILTIAISWGAEDLMIQSLESKDEIISVPLLTYIIGGIAVFILTLISFFKSN